MFTEGDQSIPVKLRLWAQTVQGGQWIGPGEFSFPPWHFGSAIESLLAANQALGGFPLDTDAAVDRLIESIHQQTLAAEEVVLEDLKPLGPAEILTNLGAAGFKRLHTQSTFDLRNISRLHAMKHGANFSVPGAGKTNALLALHALERARQDNLHLMVICPKNAMISWDQEIEDCLGSDYKFLRLTGGLSSVKSMLSKSPRFSLISYQQLQTAIEPVLDFLYRLPVHLVLDESHRIKAGDASLQGKLALMLAPFARRRDILSGTPMPQGISDIVAQFDFLWPKVGLAAEIELQTDPSRKLEVARNFIEPFYVRTTKPELGIRPPDVRELKVGMSEEEADVYALMRSFTAQSLAGLDSEDKSVYRKFGKTLMRLLQFASYPPLLKVPAENFGVGTDLLDRLSRLTPDSSSKLNALDQYVHETLKDSGEKIVVWSSFLGAIQMLESRFGEYGATSIHGGVSTGDEDDDETREGRIRRFHQDKHCRVLVANPAACGEGISLHKAAHNAIYLDRTFNAAHYLQSIDRINRRGLPKDVITRVRILTLTGTIDDVVSSRLRLKVDALQKLLSDKSLSAMVYDPEDIEEFQTEEVSLDAEDMRAVRQHLGH